MMLPFFKSSKQLPNLQQFCLEPYKVDFSLAKLVPGVDNVRYDVRLSPELIKSTRKIIRYLLAKHTRSQEILETETSTSFQDDQKEFEDYYVSVLIGAVNQAKMQKEIQIDFLAQTSIIKMVLGEIRNQYEYLIQSFIKEIRHIELSSKKDLPSVIRLKEQLSSVRSKRNSIIRNLGIELFQYLSQLQDKHINPIREINFGSEIAVYSDIFTNPILHMEDSHDDFFIMEEYSILLGKRFDDPDQYSTLIDLLKSILTELYFPHMELQHQEISNQQTEASLFINELIKQAKNIDLLINFFQSKSQYRLLAKSKSSKAELRTLKHKIKHQKNLFAFFYKNFNRKGLIRKIVASHQIRPVAQEYCPPLMPQQMVQYILMPLKRRGILRQLKRSAIFYGKSFSFKPLKKQVRSWEKTSPQKRKEIFIEFLKGLIRYHRDFENYKLLKEAMDYVNIIKDEKMANLSRTNRTLFEFILPKESVADEKPIINHVIIKADVRGSTNITQQMKDKGLNPASYFSMNFFNPITQILPEYGASKVFIEGDAIILAITEHEKTPEGWYSVARACGLSINILSIVNRYNLQCRKKQLPILELGIGISYQNSPPAFLFDEENKIMISPAINQADRLSSCSKKLRKQLQNAKKPFNIYLFQTTPAKIQSASYESETCLRYNVNGIELSMSAFRKLTEEIDLKITKTTLPEISNQELTIHFGKFQTLTGKFKMLAIREAQILEFISEDSSSSLRKTTQKYFEVVTNPHIYRYIEPLL